MESTFVEVGVFVQDSGVHGYKAGRAKGLFSCMFVDYSSLVLRWTFGVVEWREVMVRRKVVFAYGG